MNTSPNQQRYTSLLGFCDVTPYSLVREHMLFAGTCCLQIDNYSSLKMEPGCCVSARLQRVTSQKTVNLTFRVMRAPDLIKNGKAIPVTGRGGP
jgi:hypothetical protein